MSQTTLRFSVQVTADPSDGLKGRSDAFRLPGARVVSAQATDGSLAPQPSLRDGHLVVAPNGATVSVATLEVPDDLVLQSKLDEQKFALEQEKSRYEEDNRRRTFLWSIGSALLTAAVTLGVAFINKGDSAKPAGTGATPDAVQACRSSLKRLPLLTRMNGQTVQALAEAIDRHEADCDDVLVKTMGSR